jgi:hypothetical protein
LKSSIVGLSGRGGIGFSSSLAIAVLRIPMAVCRGGREEWPPISFDKIQALDASPDVEEGI